MAQYEIILLGSPTPEQRSTIEQRLATAVSGFDLSGTDGLAVRTASDFDLRDPMAATVALYFGGDPTIDEDRVFTLDSARTPIVPVLMPGESVSHTIPASLQPINACFIEPTDQDLEAVSALALECVGLLHEQRRIFISYRRDDSREVAIQLHDELCGRGFDVFLDTHSIRPGSIFQQTLWHRLADCDVTIMLDTAGYFASKWTRQELGRTLAHGIHVLRLVWPAHNPTRSISLSDTIRLAQTSLDASGRLDAATIATIASRTEALRSRSVAWRHRTLVAKLRTEVNSIGGRFDGVGPHHSVPLTLPKGLEVQAYPAVGVPTALMLNDIHTKARGAGSSRHPCLVYDDAGLSPLWQDHLAWLNSNIADVKVIKVANARQELAAWET